jgi:hypothetical protein
MGEPSLFQGHDGRFEPRVEPTNGVKPRAPYDGEYLKSEAFLRFVGELLLARLRFRVRLPREWKSIRWSETRDRLHSVESSLVGATIRDPVPGLIDFFIEPWRALTERHWNTTRKKLVAPFLREVGHSRREWLREVEKSLAGLSYTGGKVEVKYIPLGGSSGIQGREDWSSIANDKKEDYGKEETSLFARRTAPKDQPLSVAIRPDHVIRLNAMGFSPFHRPRHRLRPGRSHRGAPGSEPVSDHAARGGRF